MTHPIFIAIEASSPDPDAYPISIAWSTPEGTVKSTLISPDDDWEPWYSVDSDIDVQLLFDSGATSSEVMLEINNDASGKTVFYRDFVHEPETLIDMLSDSASSEPDFELADWKNLFSDQQIQEYTNVESSFLFQIDGDPGSPEARVKLLLLVYDRLNNKDI